ncbi:MAG: hypothetical protein M3M85_02365, partial [bacterium]|nr:hypothetical protein [bacterium]
MPLNECSAPCKMYVGWDVEIKTGGRPALVKFFGKKEWLPVGREDQRWTLDQFSPGEAEFAPPDDMPSNA